MSESIYHQAANLFPLMEGEDFDNLKSDILKQGELNPIIPFEGKILDGRNRYRSCQELELTCWEYYPGSFVGEKKEESEHYQSRVDSWYQSKKSWYLPVYKE